MFDFWAASTFKCWDYGHVLPYIPVDRVLEIKSRIYMLLKQSTELHPQPRFFLKYLNILFLFHVYECFAYMHVYCMSGAQGVQKRAAYFPELGIQIDGRELSCGC